MEKHDTSEQKKTWETPKMVVYGDMNLLTQQGKPKVPGDRDDFMTTPGVSTLP